MHRAGDWGAQSHDEEEKMLHGIGVSEDCSGILGRRRRNVVVTEEGEVVMVERWRNRGIGRDVRLI